MSNVSKSTEGSSCSHAGAVKLKVVAYLVGEAHCDTTTADKHGATPLLVACLQVSVLGFIFVFIA